MNLFDMVRRGDKNISLSGDVRMAARTYPGGRWRGLELPTNSAFKIPDVRRFVNFRHFPADCGWQVEVASGSRVRIAFTASGTDDVLSEHFYEVKGGLRPLLLPWPNRICGRVDLIVSCEGKGEEVAFVANHRILSRDWLYSMCEGKGVEIGPGPVPQILPSEKTAVSYLEQMPAEEWNRLYNRGGKYPTRPELWQHYIVGDASAIPVADSTLHFIFGSHVFEHLANPIGHLRNWRKKLAPGGRVLMVVPDLHGTKDSIQCRSSLESWIDEDRRGIWQPEAAHYERHLRRSREDPTLIHKMEISESIHVHYYDNINCQILLEYAVVELGYEDYIIKHTQNHKDFHFVLVNGKGE